jgi:hypothetical protein
MRVLSLSYTFSTCDRRALACVWEHHISLVTGQYDSAPSKQSETIDLQALPGQGPILKYKSVAADFLKSREYQGLEAKLGTTQAQPAIPGQSGIASDYGK